LQRWLAAGPIQDPDGGIYAWCDPQFRPSYVYPEISGYLLTALASGTDTDDALRERASRCASYLADRVRSGRLGARPPAEAAIYSFDLAMIATGLMRAHQEFGTPGRAEALRLAALLRDRILATGALPPLLAADDPLSRRKWSTAGTLHLVKCVQALLLAEQCGLERAREAADALAEATLRRLRARPTPYTCPGSTEIHLHAVLYCAEGLWMYGDARGHHGAHCRARALVDFVLARIDDDGGLPATIGGAPAANQSDVMAQAIRLGVLTEIPREVLAPVVASLGRFVRTAGRWTAVEYRIGSGHLNTWSTIFAVQAHTVWREGGGSLPWWRLA
jgi:hypothetical protein